MLDAGCGTGQMSLPLAAMGYDVVGFDISLDMVGIARAKCGCEGTANYAVGDVRALPLADNSVDGATASKLLEHVSDWRKAVSELLRVLKPGASLMLIHERGHFGNPVRQFFARGADEAGFVDRFPGVMGQELLEALAAAGCQLVTVPAADLKWDWSVTYGDVIAQFGERLFAEYWYLPDEVYMRLLAETTAWVDALREGRATVARMSPFLVALAARKKA